MNVKGIVFDLNGTLSNIHTGGGGEKTYRGSSHHPTYRGVRILRGDLRVEDYERMDAVALWRALLQRRPEGTVLGMTRCSRRNLFRSF